MGVVFAGLLPTLARDLPKVRVAADSKTFATADGRKFAPIGVTYYRPGTGWAPQVWKQWDAEATRKDFALMKEYGVNCVRIFLSYGSFCPEAGKLDPEGLRKFDQLVAIAEDTGIYLHPTGPDHWEGTPDWSRDDRIADEKALNGLVSFWTDFAARYRGRPVIFAYDLRNEPEVSWDNAVMRRRWAAWVSQHYPSVQAANAAWGVPGEALEIPAPANESRRAFLLDYQHFREDIADEWTQKQAEAIKRSDPAALVTAGLVQWSVPIALPRVGHYAAFNPARQARFLDFQEIHFYPLARGVYEYKDANEEAQNLSYLQATVRQVALTGKPVVVAEFGWYGGGKPVFDQGKHPAATEEQQAQWCRKLVESTSGLACGWLNWGFFDQPEATDTSQLSGLLKADGTPKAWGRTFKSLAGKLDKLPARQKDGAPALPWEDCITSTRAQGEFQQRYFDWFKNQ